MLQSAGMVLRQRPWMERNRRRHGDVFTVHLYGIEKIADEQVPAIFLVDEPYWYEYNTIKYDGWTDQGNLYAEPSPYMYPDAEIVLLNLHQ